MADLQIVFAGRRAGDNFQRSIFARGTAFQADVRGAVQDAAAEIKQQGAANIAGAGKFGKRWTEGLDATVSEENGALSLGVTHSEPLFPVFEEGRTIQGKPTLWIPLGISFGGQADAQGVRARDYGKPLFRIDRKSGKAPLLFSWTPGSKGSARPVYFGKSSVTIPRKFRVREIVASVVAQLGNLYRARRDAA